MTYLESLEYIHSLPRFKGEATLCRITELMNALGNPQKELKFIHVAGTNGKGSVCSFLASALKESGKKVGLFVSPYIIDFCERIQINGEFIEKDDLATFATEVKNVGVSVTEFEFITAVAFLYYKYKGCDVVVLETGLGGRFDATNVIPAPLAAVITGIGLDHTEILGDTVEKIAYEKCGIIKEGSIVATTFNQPDSALRVITAVAKAKVPQKEKLTVKSASACGNSFIYKGIEYKTALIGEYQIENAVLAIETLAALGVESNAIVKGIANAQIPARLELLSKEPLVLLDGAHNPHGARSLAEVLKKNRGATAIIGMMADKNCDETLALTLPHLERVITIKVDNPRSLKAEELAAKAKNYCADVTVADSLEQALELAGRETPVFIFGSLYLASSIRSLAKKFYS